MTPLQNIAGVVGAISAIVTTSYGLDRRYVDTAESASAIEEIRQAANADSLEIRIEAARIKLKLLRDKETRGALTPDEKDELEFTLKLIADLQAARLKK